MDNISFLTPYLSGTTMMALHLESIRNFYPDAEILVSKRGDDDMEQLAEVFKVKYWLSDVWYVDAVKELLERAENDIVVISDHDVVFLSSLDKYQKMIEDGEIDLLGIEENIKHPWGDTYMRWAPGFTDMTIFMFDKRKISKNWPTYHNELYPENVTSETHYGLCEELKRHYYLRPYHTEKYGMGNLLKDGDENIAWHQWYGSYRTRLITAQSDKVYHHGGTQYLKAAEDNFIRDYPNLDFTNIRPAFKE